MRRTFSYHLGPYRRTYKQNPMRRASYTFSYCLASRRMPNIFLNNATRQNVKRISAWKFFI
ncbi:hypothetical protein HanXRQr2_Chr03g0124681 [Helianthus annuus]|uniref:Uncharacterized protein n=1 Tax=Helianthus annuus TaxID=4232 RepID=A0A9K3NWZ5_HELAN|nr:hypothetical protein HanXRQr2_Chr03g0124681 [Helianthus annuus]